MVGPVVGNGGYWEGVLVSVRSQDIEHGGVNIAVKAASGAVIVADMVAKRYNYVGCIS